LIANFDDYISTASGQLASYT